MTNNNSLKFNQNIRSLRTSGVIAHPAYPMDAGGPGAIAPAGPLGAKMSRIGDWAHSAYPQGKALTNQEVLDAVRY